ncbi:vesicle transport through interaction with t-SNAREs homolog 1A-like [Centroberyx affinis]|uniref:vesicle transport through interaction with t-SNAREs homolog 1A-like n=1 Tax=Centroberyx affinis TaxID=166261 RepID=UPI003A5B9722
MPGDRGEAVKVGGKLRGGGSVPPRVPCHGRARPGPCATVPCASPVSAPSAPGHCGGGAWGAVTQQVGQEILANLHTDREKIQRARERLRETDANLGKSSRILTGMLRRIIQNRILVFILGAIILLTIILAIYFNLRGH